MYIDRWNDFKNSQFASNVSLGWSPINFTADNEDDTVLIIFNM